MGLESTQDAPLLIVIDAFLGILLGALGKRLGRAIRERSGVVGEASQ
jgi:hypothetical protein